MLMALAGMIGVVFAGMVADAAFGMLQSPDEPEDAPEGGAEPMAEPEEDHGDLLDWAATNPVEVNGRSGGGEMEEADANHDEEDGNEPRDETAAPDDGTDADGEFAVAPLAEGDPAFGPSAEIDQGADIVRDASEPAEVSATAESAGDDTIAGTFGDDRIAAGAGDDRVEAGDGDDILHGNEGDDLLDGHGDHAADFLNGGEGDDRLVMGDGDIASGGNGSDQFLLQDWEGPAGLARIEDFDPTTDQIVVFYDPSAHPDPEVSFDPMHGIDGTVVKLDGLPVAELPGITDPHPDMIRLETDPPLAA